MYSDRYFKEKSGQSDEEINQCIENFGALKISALTSANKIKQYVKYVTIGPNAAGKNEIQITLSEIKVPPSRESNIKSRLGPIPNDSKIQSTLNTIQDNIENSPCNENNIDLSQKEQISVNMLRYENNLSNRQTVRKKVRDLQAKFRNIDKNLQLKSTQEFNNSQFCLNKRLEKIESEILQDLEKHQYDINKKQQKLLQEHEEQCQQLLKQTLEFKQDQEIRKQRLKKKAELDAIYVCQKVFRNQYEDFINKFRTYKDAISKQVFAENSNQLKILVNNMDKIALKYKTEAISSEDVSNAKQMVNCLKNLCDLISSEYQNRVESYNQQLLKEQYQQLQQQQIVKNNEEIHIKQESAIVQVDNDPKKMIDMKCSENSSEHINRNKLNWQKLADYHHFVENFATNYQELKSNSNLKKFRFDCQKAVNIPVNAIAGKGEDHTQDKLEKLDSLLEGKTVRIGDMQICAGQHPQGVAFCYDLLAKSLVKQGALVSSNPESAFPIAYVIAALWSKYPDFGKLILGYFYEKCPYLVPVYPIKTSDITEEEYLRLLGYDISSDGIVEPKDLFLRRICGTARLYFAIMVVSCNNKHPFCLENAWSWLAGTLNSAPIADISSSLILQCLDVTGNAQMRCYKNQFSKVIMLLINDYLIELGKVDSGGPFVRLKEFLIKTMETGVIEPPKLTTNTDNFDYL